MLNGYFAPHSLLSLLYFLAVLLCFEIAGWGIVNSLKLKLPTYLRSSYWLLGFGLIAFLVFLQHLVLPYSGILFNGFLLIGTLPYITSWWKQRPQHLASLKSTWPLLVLLMPLVPYLFIKTSLPPYTWDEMAYHYISPYRLLNEDKYHFGGLYDNLPRSLENIYIALFATTKSYALARTLQLAMAITMLSVLYQWLVRALGKLFAFGVTTAFVFINIELLYQATLGYIDMGVTAVVVIALIAAAEFILGADPGAFRYFLLISSVAVGIKYNAIITILAALPPVVLRLLGLVPTNRKKLIRQLIATTPLMFVLGGYWYLKNWYVTGNPIYPFLFGCNTGDCGTGQAFFWWATAINLSNAPLILGRLLQPLPWQSALIIGGLLFTLRSHKLGRALTVLTVITLIEALIVARIAGFELRYFFHWRSLVQLITLATLATMTLKIVSTRLLRLGVPLFAVVGILVAGVVLKRAYANYFNNGPQAYETQYSLGKIDIYQWVRQTFPLTAEAVFWCDRQTQVQSFKVMDPDLLWFTPEAQNHIFLTNCSNNGFKPGQPKLYLSLDDCANPNQPPKRNQHESDDIYQMRLENRSIICEATKVVPGLYLAK